MKKLKGLGILVGMSAMVLAGCQGGGAAPEQTPEEVVKEGLSNFYELRAYTYDFNINGDAAVEGDTVDFDVTLSGSQDTTTPTDPKIVLKLDASGSMNGEAEESVAAELRITKEKLYFMVSELSDFQGLLPAESVASMLSKWWMMEIPAGTFDDLPVAAGTTEELTPEQQQMKELLQNTKFFTELAYVGEEAGAHKYSGVLDKEAVKVFAEEAAKINGQPLTDADKTEMATVLEDVSLTVEVLVDQKTMTATGLAGTLVVDNEEGKFNVNFDLDLANLNEAVVVEEPADAELFDPMALFMGMPMGVPAE